MKKHTPGRLFTSSICLILLFLSSTAFAQSDEEKDFLSLYFTKDELNVVSATRTLTSISQVAENITVITADQIELMNAHTLADVLDTVTGVHLNSSSGPGQFHAPSVQGSDPRHVTVMIDGVVLNTVGDNQAETGMIPVQMIRKIEIIKGPASSTWGSALGGVVNVITKAGSLDNQGNMLQASYGTNNSGDFRAETMGKQDRLGYYLTAGRLQSDGLTPHFGLSNDNAYAKLSYDLTDATDILFTLGYLNTHRDNGEDSPYDTGYKSISELAYSTLAVNTVLSKDLTLNISFRNIENGTVFRSNQISTGTQLSDDKAMDTGYGASVKLTWKDSIHTVVVGADYDDRWLKSDIFLQNLLALRRTALYLNDTILLGPLSLTPGVRYDKTNTNGDITSPSLGAAYSLTNNTILRAYTANGFNIPPVGYKFGNGSSFGPSPALKPEKVQSYQVGVETAALKYLWMKASAFRNEIRRAIFLAQDPNTFVITAENAIRQRRQGLDLEAKTAPVYHTSLTAGAEFIDAKDLDTEQRLLDVPTRVYDVGLQYNDENSFKALLNGRYIDWNATPGLGAKDKTFVFNLNMIKKIYSHKDASLEAFLDLHNIFNTSQYDDPYYQNPERWYEGGLRYSF